MSTYIGPDGRRVVDPGKLPRTDVRRLRKAAKRTKPKPSPDQGATEQESSDDDAPAGPRG